MLSSKVNEKKEVAKTWKHAENTGKRPIHHLPINHHSRAVTTEYKTPKQNPHCYIKL
jgi:hypothetical protein